MGVAGFKCIMIEYCGYGYDADEKGNYNIIPNKDIIRPKNFFKYYALSEYSVDALINMYIYATHPNQFNDPFECNEKLIKFDSWEDVENLWEIPKLIENIKKIYPNLDDACRYSSECFKMLIYRHLGLFSLAPKVDNYLMWALYSKNNGFCVEYNIDQFQFRHFGPFPVNYVEDVSGPINIGGTGGHTAMLIQSNIKNCWWQYEEEWRLYIPNPHGVDMKSFGYEADKYNRVNDHDRKFNYPIEAICSVILGTSFLNDSKITVISPKAIEVVCGNNKNNQYVSRILNFLSIHQQGTDIHVFLTVLSGFSKYEFIPIKIIKYCDNHYRIIENDK